MNHFLFMNFKTHHPVPLFPVSFDQLMPRKQPKWYTDVNNNKLSEPSTHKSLTLFLCAYTLLRRIQNEIKACPSQLKHNRSTSHSSK